jgi:dTDP-4-dehydrorhamnose 3,5-epimerase
VCDEKGFSGRTWCRREFAPRGFDSILVQCHVSLNNCKAFLDCAAFATKVVCSTTGAIYDAVVDLPRESPMFKRWVGVVLTADNRNMIDIPKECAHGFLTLEDQSEVFYQMAEFYERK